MEKDHILRLNLVFSLFNKYFQSYGQFDSIISEFQLLKKCERRDNHPYYRYFRTIDLACQTLCRVDQNDK